uniref:Cilia- and flagella-associated protein 36 n=1 Tax=Angiostrongylus cantonensis TaxID=6313 RepID=A0A0K0DDF5_ANGCA
MLRRLTRKNSSSGKNILGKFLEFIDSPIWALPIANFIEHRSIVFDRQQGSITMYEKIHKEFTELVNTLTECFCADSSIPVDSLRQELKNAEADKLTIRQKASTSLEPIAAAENFNVFVPMMMRKNVELQLQALQMIEFMCGLIPSVLQIEDGETLRNKPRLFSPEETERYV